MVSARQMMNTGAGRIVNRLVEILLKASGMGTMMKQTPQTVVQNSTEPLVCLMYSKCGKAMKQYLQDRQHCHDCYRELKIHDKKEDVYIPLQSNAHPKSKTGNGSNVKENKGYE